MTKPQICVLIVEDDMVDRMACRRALTQDPDCEFVLLEAETGREGLQLAYAHKPDCVLLDYHLPDLNGLEFLAELADDTGAIQIPVIMQTGADNAAVAVETMKRGAQDYLIKDVDRQYLELLSAVILRVMRERRMLAEKKQTEAKLLQAEAKYRTLVEQIPAITYVASLIETNPILYISPQIKKALGFSQEEWLADPELHVRQIHPDDRVRVLDELAQSRLKSKPLCCEYRLLSRGGMVFWFRDEASVVQDESGRSLFLQGILVDITERKRAEEEILERRKEMEALQKRQVVAQTVAAIAHEVNQPLQSIATYSEAALMMLEAGNPNINKVRQAVEATGAQAHRAGQSIRELLNFLSMNESSTESFDLNREILDILTTAKVEHGLQFQSVPQLEEDLPLVIANRIHVQKVLLNLLHNSIEAMQGVGEPQPSIIVRTMRDGNIAQVTIQDKGPGFKSENIQRLFEPFFTTKTSGIGIGLVISRSLIEANGGQLWVDPKEGPGATFHLTLPLAS